MYSESLTIYPLCRSYLLFLLHHCYTQLLTITHYMTAKRFQSIMSKKKNVIFPPLLIALLASGWIHSQVTLISMALQQQWIMCSHPIYLSAFSQLATTAYLFHDLKMDSLIFRVPYLRNGRPQFISLGTEFPQSTLSDFSLNVNRLKAPLILCLYCSYFH